MRLPAHVGDVGVVEGEVSGEEDEEDDAAGPRVGLGPVVGLAAEHLGRRVCRGAAGRVEAAVVAERVRERGEAEVGDLEVAVAVEEDVLRLDVAVRDAARVAVGERGDELHEDAARGVLGEAAPRERGEPGQQVPARRELHDEVDLGARGEHLVEAEHVGVAQPAHGRHLAEHARRHARRAHHLGLVEHLHRHGLAAAVDRPREVDLGERPSSQQPT